MASLWLVLSWTLALGFGTPVEASSASYTPGVRVMLISVAIGLMIGWPLLRLSQPATSMPMTQTILDVVVLLALLQVVIWPLRLVTPWTPVRTAALDATLVAWTLLVGALVASAVGSPRPGLRNIVMLGCLAICLAGPALAWLVVALSPAAGLADRVLTIGTLLEIHTLGLGGGTAPSATQWAWIGLVGLAAATTWAGLSFYTRLRQASDDPYGPG